MNLAELFNITRIISAFLLILFSIFLLNQKKGNLFSFRFLAAFLLARAGILIGMIFWSYEIWQTFPHIAYLETPLLFLYAPMLFLYTQTVTSTNFRWQNRYFLHFVLFFVVLSFLIVKFYIHSTETKILLITSGNTLKPFPASTITYLLWLQFVFYAVSCIVLLKKYQEKIKTYYSTIERINLSWLRFLLLAFFVWKGVFLTGYLFKILPTGYVYDGFCIFIEIGFLVYASMIVYKGLQLPELFVTSYQSSKYKTSPLQRDDKMRYLDKIETYMKTQKPYLNPNLTLKDLSKNVAIPMHYISQVLNDTREQKFYDYINYYRIQETRQALLNPKNQGKTILEILYEAGFNSKSVFNSAFKRYVGVTPRQFKQHYRLQDAHSIQNTTN